MKFNCIIRRVYTIGADLSFVTAFFNFDGLNAVIESSSADGFGPAGGSGKSVLGGGGGGGAAAAFRGGGAAGAAGAGDAGAAGARGDVAREEDDDDAVNEVDVVSLGDDTVVLNVLDFREDDLEDLERRVSGSSLFLGSSRALEFILSACLISSFSTTSSNLMGEGWTLIGSGAEAKKGSLYNSASVGIMASPVGRRIRCKRSLIAAEAH